MFYQWTLCFFCLVSVWQESKIEEHLEAIQNLAWKRTGHVNYTQLLEIFYDTERHAMLNTSLLLNERHKNQPKWNQKCKVYEFDMPSENPYHQPTISYPQIPPPQYLYLLRYIHVCLLKLQPITDPRTWTFQVDFALKSKSNTCVVIKPIERAKRYVFWIIRT